MGSIGSSPQTSPQVVYVPAPVSTVSNTSPSGSNSDNNIESENTETTSAQARTQSLLRRGRGRFGTIRTSFLGLLGGDNNDGERKTLLGQ